jgi:16S rRNA (uracil1498-N3)-methyltransferase
MVPLAPNAVQCKSKDMSNATTKYRQFYVPDALSSGAEITLPAPLAGRLSKVLRLKAGAMIGLLNGQDGLWEATLVNDKATKALAVKQLLPQPAASGPTLLIGLPKKEAMDTVLRQATELGVQRIVPLKLDFSVPTKFNTARGQAIIHEAVEQCERLTVPELAPLTTLTEALSAHPTIYWAREDAPANAHLPNKPEASAALLIGPEGGFSPAEKALLSAQKNIRPFTLGNTILRTDTAVVAALAKLL